MLLILSITDLKPEFRNCEAKPEYSHLNEAAEKAALYCSTVILQDSRTNLDVVLKSRD